MRKVMFVLPFLIFLFTFILTSCTSSKKDGPPSFYVDASRIPNAVPRVEPRSKYGNYSSYVVFGKRYHVMRSSKNYVGIGVASWYGTKFHHRLTSSGERYNMLSMTAAHRTLPLPTYVEVTNLRNNRKIIVKVNDRGPFEQNRLIDLSYVAAKKLGMTGRGTALVQVKALDPYPQAPYFGATNSKAIWASNHPAAHKKNILAFKTKKKSKHVIANRTVVHKKRLRAYSKSRYAEPKSLSLRAKRSNPSGLDCFAANGCSQ